MTRLLFSMTLLLSMHTFAASKMRVKLLIDKKVPIIGDNGKVMGSMKIKRGTVVEVVQEQGDQIQLKRRKILFFIDKDKTTYAKVLKKLIAKQDKIAKRKAEQKNQADTENEDRKNSAEEAKKQAALKKASDEIRELFGETLRDKDGKKVSVDKLGKKNIGIYFSAHWCPPCRQFTPHLVKFQNDLTAAGKAFEIVFVSADRSEDAMNKYMQGSKMPWLALPFGDKRRGPLQQKFGITGYPTLIIIDENGKLITNNGRGDVGKGTKIFDVWAK